MHPATIATIRTTRTAIRRQLNHLHSSINNHSQPSTPQDPHLLHWHYSQFENNNFKIHGETLFYIFILFSVILFITLLLLYARWFFRFRHPSTAAAGVPSNSVSLQHIVIQLPAHRTIGLQRQPSGLEPSVINSLPIVLHQSKEDELLECCICLGGFEDGDKVKVLPNCKHQYHSECVDRWLISHSSCPLCRIAIRVDPIQTTNESV